MKFASHVLTELSAAGLPTVRALLLRRGFGMSRDQRRALSAGRAATFTSEWIASQYREDQHPAFPSNFGASATWRLEADGTTLTPMA